MPRHRHIQTKTAGPCHLRWGCTWGSGCNDIIDPAGPLGLDKVPGTNCRDLGHANIEQGPQVVLSLLQAHQHMRGCQFMNS